MRSAHSYSGYSTYLRCPAAYRLCYIEGDPGVTRQALRDGSDRHEAFAAYARHCFARKRGSDLDEARRIAAGYPNVRDDLEVFFDDWRFEWGMVIVEDAVVVEQEFRAMLPDGRTEFTGHLDLVQRWEGAASAAALPFGQDDAQDGDGDLWVVTDLKSRLYGDVWDDQPPMQLRWYAWLLQQRHPEARAIRVIMQAMCTGQVRSWDLGGDLSYVGEELQGIADRIAREDQWEAQIGQPCQSCLHILTCPHEDKRTPQEIRETPPELALRLYLFHGAKRAAYGDICEEHAKQSGPIHSGGMVYEGRTASAYKPCQPATLREDVAHYGISYDDLTGGLQKTAIERAAKGLGEGQREEFLGLFELVPHGGPRYMAYKQAPEKGKGGDDGGE